MFLFHYTRFLCLTEITNSDDVIDLLSQRGRIRTKQQPASIFVNCTRPATDDTAQARTTPLAPVQLQKKYL